MYSLLRRNVLRSNVMRNNVVRSNAVRGNVLRSYVWRSNVLRNNVFRSYVLSVQCYLTVDCLLFSETLSEMLGVLFLPCDTPEAPKKSFLQNLFGGGANTLDREELCKSSLSLYTNTAASM